MKTFIIYNPNDHLSIKLSTESIESCVRFEIYPELFSGVFDNDINKMLKEYNLVDAFFAPELTHGERGCFLSHFCLWKKCIELNEPILILEHDIKMIQKIPNDVLDRFTELLNLDLCGSLRKKYDEYLECMKKVGLIKIERLVNQNQLPNNISWKSAKQCHVAGAHAYIIKPIAAQKLILAAEKNGCLPVDVHINSHYIDIFVCDPSIIRTCDFMINKKNRIKFSSTKGYLYGKT
jgi:GR25 family glycosyltransferase involved in LPS biosynthesis